MFVQTYLRNTSRTGDQEIIGNGQVIKTITISKNWGTFDFCSKDFYTKNSHPMKGTLSYCRNTANTILNSNKYFGTCAALVKDIRIHTAAVAN